MFCDPEHHTCQTSELPSPLPKRAGKDQGHTDQKVNSFPCKYWTQNTLQPRALFLHFLRRGSFSKPPWSTMHTTFVEFKGCLSSSCNYLRQQNSSAPNCSPTPALATSAVSEKLKVQCYVTNWFSGTYYQVGTLLIFTEKESCIPKHLLLMEGNHK